MDPAYALLSIDISREVNRIPDARLMLVDGDVARRDFPLSDSAFFEPGKEIEIKLRYEGKPEATLFKGLVVRQGVQVNAEGSVLTVEMKDAVIKLTQPRRSAVFRDLSDAELVARILQNAGLEKGDMPATEPKHAEIVQYYATDWDFILSRADIEGLLVSVEDGRLSLGRIDLAGSPAHRFELGIDEIYDVEVEADACHQHASVQSVAWDLNNQKLTPASKAKTFELSQGNLDADKIAEAIGFDAYTLSHPVPLDPKELQGWADARMARSRMAMIRGRFSVPGFADIKPLDVIALAGMGERFNGKTLVTGIRHHVDDDGWQTDLQLGLSPDWFCRQPEIQDVPAAGLLPAVSGLQIGVVDKFEQDPEKQFRAKVLLPAIDADQGAVWARLMSPDAGKGRGYFFRPEPGDEVVVGFFNDDPRQAVILGAMYSATNAPPSDLAELSEDNVDKAIVTKRGTSLRFIDNEKASVLVETAANNKILVSDDQELVQITDQHGNSITLDQNGIEIKSAKDLTIDAGANVEIKGQKVDVK